MNLSRARLWLAALLVAVSACAVAQGERAEVQIKATFLYKFGGFVDWPPSSFPAADTPLTIGVLGADALAEELERIVSGRSIQGRPVKVRRLKRGEPVAQLHILFVGQAEIPQDAGQGLLIVTDVERAQPRGSMINFVTVDDKVRFDIALAPAERGNLKISARLLAVARKVIAS